MRDPFIVIADSDALIAMLNKDDSNAATIIELLEELSALKAHILIPTTVIAEASATFQRKMGNPSLTAKLTLLVQNKNLVIKAVGEEILTKAFTIFNPLKSKHNTLFDAIVAASAIFYGADAILSFDRWYEKIGLKLVHTIIYAHNQKQ